MPWDRYIQRVINLSGSGTDTVLESLTGLTPLKSSDIVQNDAYPLRLVFVQKTGSSSDPIEIVRLEPGSVIVFSGKATSALVSADLLYYADDFAEHQDADGNYYYTAQVNTNTAEAAAAFAELASNKTTISVINEVEIQNADNTARTSFQHLGVLRRQVYAGEAAPTPATPPYPAPSNLLTRGSIFRGEPEVGADYVDIAIPSTSTNPTPWGIERPSNSLAPISLVDVVRMDATTARVLLSAAVAAAGYRVAVWAEVSPALAAETPLPSAICEGTIALNASTVDIAVPAGALHVTPLGVELPAVDAAPISIVGTYRVSPTVARAYLSAAAPAINYKARILAPVA